MDDKTKCKTCELRIQNEQGRWTCRGLIDKAYEQADNGIYNCPFYKPKKKEDKK